MRCRRAGDGGQGVRSRLVAEDPSYRQWFTQFTVVPIALTDQIPFLLPALRLNLRHLRASLQPRD